MQVFAIRSRAERLYALLFVFLILFWPCWAFTTTWLLILALVVNTAIFAFTVWQVSGVEYNFLKGMSMIAMTFESGCINLTFIYIPIVLLYYYLLSIRKAFQSISRRESAQSWFANTVYNRFPSREAYEAAKQSPKWFS